MQHHAICKRGEDLHHAFAKVIQEWEICVKKLLYLLFIIHQYSQKMAQSIATVPVAKRYLRRYRYESIIIDTFLDRMRAIKLTNKQYTRILLYFVIH